MASVLGSFRLLARAAASPSLAKFPLGAIGAIGANHNYQPQRGHKKWYPDKQFFEQFEGVVMYPEEARWTRPLETNGLLCF